jgi:uncharacterized protein
MLDGQGSDMAGGACQGAKASSLMDAVARVREAAKKIFDTARGSHDWEHTQRVVALCDRIGPGEGADMTVLRIAAYLHDIGRSCQDRSNGSVCHGARGAEMAAGIIENLSLAGEQKTNIRHCIASHRFRSHRAPQTTEAKVLFDADKLDAIGAVGVARAFLFAGEVGACLHNPHIDVTLAEPYSRNDTGYREYLVKLCQIRDRVLTATGKDLARSRHTFMESFFDRFLQEYQGRM